jgi:S1-C subfamily serine protease
VNSIQPKNIIRLNQEIISAGEQRDVVLQIQRGRERKEVSVRMIPESSFFNAKLIQQKLGVIVQDLSASKYRNVYGLNSGLLVTGIEEGSPADKAGFQKGLVIESIDGKIPGDMTTAAKLLFDKKKGQVAHLTLLVPSPLRRASVELKTR